MEGTLRSASFTASSDSKEEYPCEAARQRQKVKPHSTYLVPGSLPLRSQKPQQCTCQHIAPSEALAPLVASRNPFLQR